MASWIFSAVAAHPDIKMTVTIQEERRDELNKNIATLLTRLLTENCIAQAKKAIETDGTEGFQTAFGFVGKLAMQELMTNKDVSTAISGFEKHMDKKKFEAAFSNK